MPFKPNDKNTTLAAKQGGSTGIKFFSTISKEELRSIAIKAGKLSGQKRAHKAKMKV